MTDWAELGQTALNIGAQIYQGQVVKRDERRAARSKDFPQLGMGLGATGPQRGGGGGGMQRAQPAGYLRIGPGGIELGDTEPSGGTMDSMMVPRGPQYAIATTPSGRQKLIAIRSIGTPLLWSGDLAAVRRVARVARKLGRFIHHRRPR